MHLSAGLLQILDGGRAGFLEGADGLICQILGILQDLAGLFIGFSDNTVAGLVDFFLFGFQTLFKLFDFPFIGFNLFLLLLNGQAAVFQIGEEILKTFFILRDMALCVLYNVIRQTQTGRDRKSVALAGNANQETVGGPERFHIKFATGVLHKVSRKGVDFQLTVMSGGHCADTPVVQVIQDGNSQCRTLGGIRARTQFIEETERIHICLFQNRHDAGHVGGEGGKALLNTLFVADICVNFPEDGKLRTVQSRNMQTCLSHQGQQSYGL